MQTVTNYNCRVYLRDFCVVISVIRGIKYSLGRDIVCTENSVMRGIFGTKREELIRKERKLHSEELHNLYLSPNTAIVTKSRRNTHAYKSVLGKC